MKQKKKKSSKKLRKAITMKFNNLKFVNKCLI